MKKKYIIIVILFTIGISLIMYYGYRYFKYRKIIGHYELVEGLDLKKLDIKLNNWYIGEKKNLKCDLWGCEGYQKGTYKIKDNKIIVNFDKINHIDYNYEIINKKGKTYLILKTSDTDINKYKKIK